MLQQAYNRPTSNNIGAISGNQCEQVNTDNNKQIPQGLSRLSENICRLESVIGALYKRLDCAIRHEPDNPSSEKCAPSPVLVDIAEKINSQSIRIDNCENSISNLLQKLEL